MTLVETSLMSLLAGLPGQIVFVCGPFGWSGCFVDVGGLRVRLIRVWSTG